jgi:rubrerythrin
MTTTERLRKLAADALERVGELEDVGRRGWRCEHCGAMFAEYVNGCPKCCTGETGGSHKVVATESPDKEMRKAQ